MEKGRLAESEIFHIYNRGVDKRVVFPDVSFYTRFISIIEHNRQYDYPYSALVQRLRRAKTPQLKKRVFVELETKRIAPPVDVISFCLVPNHYHLTLKQLVEDGISDFMHRVGTSFTKYFNIRQDRTGRLFESPFQSVPVETDEQLFHLTRYHHLNPRKLVSNIQGLIDYPWSSFSTYLGKDKFSFVKPKIVLSNFKDAKDYLEFVQAEIDEYEPVRLEGVAIDDDFGWFEDFRRLKKKRQEQLRDHYYKRL